MNEALACGAMERLGDISRMRVVKRCVWTVVGTEVRSIAEPCGDAAVAANCVSGGVQAGVAARYGWTTDGALVRSNALPCGEAAVATNCVGDGVQVGVVASC